MKDIIDGVLFPVCVRFMMMFRLDSIFRQIKLAELESR